MTTTPESEQKPNPWSAEANVPERTASSTETFKGQPVFDVYVNGIEDRVLMVPVMRSPEQEGASPTVDTGWIQTAEGYSQDGRKLIRVEKPLVVDGQDHIGFKWVDLEAALQLQREIQGAENNPEAEHLPSAHIQEEIGESAVHATTELSTAGEVEGYDPDALENQKVTPELLAELHQSEARDENEAAAETPTQKRIKVQTELREAYVKHGELVSQYGDTAPDTQDQVNYINALKAEIGQLMKEEAKAKSSSVAASGSVVI